MKELKIRVVETKDFTPEVKGELSILGHLDFYDLEEGESLNDVFENYDIFWFRFKYQITSDLLNNSKRRVKYIVTPVTGLNHIAVDVCEKLNIKIICLKGETEFLQEVRATAEHTLLITLALLRKLPSAVNSVERGNWDREPFKGKEIYGKTVGIIGFGRLGRIVADYFDSFGAKVIVSELDKKVIIPSDFERLSTEELVASADIISLHIHFYEGNIGFFSKALIGLLKPSAVFINTSRGNLVNEAALVEALENDSIGGAALDVVEDEYLITKSPAVQYLNNQHPKNLLVTPHIGGNTYESFAKTEKFVLGKLISLIGQ